MLNKCSSHADTCPLTHSHPQTNTHHRRGHLFTPTHTCPQSPVTACFGQLFSEHIEWTRVPASERFSFWSSPLLHGGLSLCGSRMNQINSPHSLNVPKRSFLGVRLRSVKKNNTLHNGQCSSCWWLWTLFICSRSRIGKTFLPTQHFSLLRCHPVNFKALSTQSSYLGNMWGMFVMLCRQRGKERPDREWMLLWSPFLVL